METAISQWGIYRGYIRIMENKMETTMFWAMSLLKPLESIPQYAVNMH